MKKSNKTELIIETSKDLFSKFGSKRVTIQEICKTAKISKMTFYKYFSNKLDLVRKIKDEIVKIGFTKYDEINKMEISYPERIKLMTQWKIKFFSNINFEFIKEMISMDEIIEEYKQRYLNNIKISQEKGEIRSDLNPELIWLVSEKIFEITKEQRWKEIFEDYGQYQEQIRTLMFSGMLIRIDEK